MDLWERDETMKACSSLATDIERMQSRWKPRETHVYMSGVFQLASELKHLVT